MRFGLGSLVLGLGSWVLGLRSWVLGFRQFGFDFPKSYDLRPKTEFYDAARLVCLSISAA